eukprot:Awhi_evm2s8438
MVVGQMSRRAFWQFGNLIPAHENASIHSGLYFTLANSEFSYVAPSLMIENDKEKHSVGGLEFEFMLALSTEAPSEMHIWCEEYKLLNTGENAVMSTHNFLTLRGSKVRDPMKWYHAIQSTINTYGSKVEYLIGQHHYPKFGNQAAVDHLSMTRDVIKYTHDQSVRLFNLGYNMEEVSESIKLPDEMEKYFSTRGHYGHLKHNSKAVFQFYNGWWDANPANLQRLPPVERAQQYVGDMGGVEQVMKRGQFHLENGNYRWCAEIMNMAVFVEPNNQQAKYLEADCLEQIGYAEESGIRRNFYLTGVHELRQGKNENYPPVDLGESFVVSMPMWMLLQSIEINIDPVKAVEAEGLSLGLEVIDSNETFHIVITHSVMLSHTVDAIPNTVDVYISADSRVDLLTALMTGDPSSVNIQGDASALTDFAAIISKQSDPLWNIITPKDLYTPVPQKTYTSNTPTQTPNPSSKSSERPKSTQTEVQPLETKTTLSSEPTTTVTVTSTSTTTVYVTSTPTGIQKRNRRFNQRNL